jgi:RimJ/RimL family protein N-acetyltransferase
MAKLDVQLTTQSAATPLQGPSAVTDWRVALPTLACPTLTLREPASTDALALLTALPEDALGQIVIDPPPATLPGLDAFITRVRTERGTGALACWAIVPADTAVAVGLIGVRAMDPRAAMVEGFAVVAEEFRGTPLFQTAGRLVLGCLFNQMRVHRAEFRIDVRNGRANGALRKLGATQEGLLRRARRHDGEFHDQVLWAIVATDWSDVRAPRTASIH